MKKQNQIFQENIHVLHVHVHLEYYKSGNKIRA